MRGKMRTGEVGVKRKKRTVKGALIWINPEKNLLSSGERLKQGRELKQQIRRDNQDV